MKTAQFLFWLGVIVMLVEFLGGLINIAHFTTTNSIGLNGGTYVTVIFSSFFQGGVLMGLGKIIETLHNKR